MITTMAAMPISNHIILASTDRTLKRWDLSTGECENIIEGYEGSVTAMTITPDEQYVFLGLKDGTLELWNLKTGTGDPRANASYF
jgi:WD40 repeat protein